MSRSVLVIFCFFLFFFIVGGENYYSNTHSGRRFCSIHDHSNNIRTVGMGEFIGVLNGVEFRTRHNDYRLYRPSKTSKDYHKQEEVPFPDVPPEVTNAGDIQAQISEMKEWFKAWTTGDSSVRDYTKYFKPVLTYLEGAWTLGKKDGSIDEPFSSDRHHIDAKSWLDLQDKVRLIFNNVMTVDLKHSEIFLKLTSVQKSSVRIIERAFRFKPCPF